MSTESRTIINPDVGKKLPSSVDFMLLGKCNLDCSFCFGPQHEIPAIKTDLAIQTIRKLALNGVESVVFTGGEPTLINDLPKIIEAAKSTGLTTVLSTNGLLLEKNDVLLNDIAKNLDWISLPLDADLPEINEKMRTGLTAEVGTKIFNAVLNLIPKIKDKYPKLGIKLGTVVAQPNLNNIVGIPELLASKNATPTTWKLYQISPSGYGKKNYDSLRISEKQFEEVCAKAKESALKNNIYLITRYTNTDRPGRNLFINPKGDALIVRDDSNDYYRIGNFLNDFNGVVNKCKSYVDKDLVRKNFETTYPKTP